MTYLEEYHDLIQRGEIVAGYWMRKEIQNLIEDLQDPRYIYDTTQAHKRMDFQQHFCLQSKQPYYGKPLELVIWQRAYWETLYSFRMADTGLLRFTESLLEIARKNGKSTMFAGDAMYDLFLGAGGMDICCASNDDRQARLIWGEIAGMRERLDPKRALTKPTLTELKNRSRGITVFRLSSKTQNKDGFNISKTLMDESHDVSEENGTSAVAEACWRGMSSKDEPLFLNCTTQGFNRGCYLDKKIDYAKKVIRGEIDDVHFLPWLYEQDSEQEIWQDERTWEKSNPSLRYGIKKAGKLRRDVEAAKHDKATRVHLLTKDFNIPQDSAQAWLMLSDYDYKTDPVDMERFRGSYLLGAVDLSATTDLTHARALLLTPGSGEKFMIGQYFIPESKLENSDDKAAGAKYADWARAGLLTINEGQEVDLAAVADWFFMLFKNYGIRPFKIGYDERYAKVFINRASDYGFELEMLAQGRALSNAMKLTEADLKHRVINYGMNEIDRWCLGNTCCEVDGVGNIQPRKVPGQQARRIDGALTMIMLEEVYRRYGNDFRRICGVA
jgi:phage terminase large subunit-like protein